MIYLDTSALVAYYLPELASDAVQAILQANPVPVISELVHLVLYSALAIRVRTQTLAQGDARSVIGTFEKHLQDSYYLKVPVTPGHYQTARDFIGTLSSPLKGPDALHLSVAFAGSYILVTADEQLARNAKQFGVVVQVVP